METRNDSACDPSCGSPGAKRLGCSSEELSINPSVPEDIELEIVTIDIERHNGREFCGTLEFKYGKRSCVLLWTVEWQRIPEVLVEFFPGTNLDVTGVVKLHQTVLIDHLLNTLVQRIGKETLFT